MMTTLLFAVFPWTAPPLILQEEAPTTRPAAEATTADLAEEFAALEVELEVAMKIWWAAYEAEGEAGAELPDYPVESFKPRYQAIAEQGLLGAQLWMMNNSDWVDSAGRLKWLKRALLEHSDSEELEDVFLGLTWSFHADNGGFFELLDAFKAKTELPSYKLAATGTRALIFCESGTDEQRAEGLALLKELSEVKTFFPGKSSVESAIFIAENLLVGMIAPNFDAVDVDGEPISLSDYRGKVTIVDFWGFW